VPLPPGTESGTQRWLKARSDALEHAAAPASITVAAFDPATGAYFDNCSAGAFEAAAKTIKAAKAHGKQTAAGVAPQDLPFWIEQGVDLLFCTNDIAAMKMGAAHALSAAREAMETSGARK